MTANPPPHTHIHTHFFLIVALLKQGTKYPRREEAGQLRRPLNAINISTEFIYFDIKLFANFYGILLFLHFRNKTTLPLNELKITQFFYQYHVRHLRKVERKIYKNPTERSSRKRNLY